MNWRRDTSMLFAENAQSSGNLIYFCYKGDIFLKNGIAYCNAIRLSIDDRLNKKYKISEGKISFEMNDFQMIFIRLNPPFDITYLTVTHFLTFIDKKKTLVINDPYVFQTSSEKLIAAHFPEFMPETIMTSNFNMMEEFLEQNNSIVLKPMHSYGSDDVFLIHKGDYNFRFIFDNLLQKYNKCYIIGQKFIENVKKGDKRVLVVGEEIIGSFLRVPKKNSILSGTVHGSSLILSDLKEKEAEIVNKIKDFMKKNKIYFAGIDLIDEYLTEVNFTSPTGLPILSELTNLDYGKKAWMLIEEIYRKEMDSDNM